MAWLPITGAMFDRAQKAMSMYTSRDVRKLRGKGVDGVVFLWKCIPSPTALKTCKSGERHSKGARGGVEAQFVPVLAKPL